MADSINAECLRIDAYASSKDIKKLKSLREDYIFWMKAVPDYKDEWIETINYCDDKILEIDARYVKKELE